MTKSRYIKQTILYNRLYLTGHRANTKYDSSLMIHFLHQLSGWSGAFVLRRLDYLVELSTFGTLALWDWYKAIKVFDRYSYRSLTSQLIFSGIDALPSILFLAVVTGFVFTFRLISVFDSIADTATILYYFVVLEIGPMITAIVLISRTGSAITVDLGNMKLHREIDSLEQMGIDVNQFLIAPRIIAVIMSQLAIAVFYTMVTLGAGIVLSGLLLSPTFFKYFTELLTQLEPLIVIVFIVKNILFGIFIGSISCYHGLMVGISATEVPQQTQKSIVNSLLMLFIIDGIIALLLI